MNAPASVPLSQEMRLKVALRAVSGISALSTAIAESLEGSMEPAAVEMARRASCLADFVCSAIWDGGQTFESLSDQVFRLYGRHLDNPAKVPQ